MTCADIRTKCAPHATAINIAVLCAFTAALICTIDSDNHDHGSHANTVLLDAGHWVLVALLVLARFQPANCVKSDMEITWVVYGFMLGELDLDTVASVCLVAISAIAFLSHRRQVRKASAATCTPAADADGTSASRV